MIDITENLLLKLRTNLLQDKRKNGELKDKLHEMFEFNKMEFNKIKRLYGKTNSRIGKDIFGKMQFEHYEIEKLKKEMYGDDYEIESFGYE